MPKKFDEVWHDIIELARSDDEISTLVQKKLNYILRVDNEKIIVQSKATENQRELLKENFQYAWNKLIQFGKIVLNDIEPELRGRKSIIFTFLEKLPYIEYKTKPLTLQLTIDKST